MTTRIRLAGWPLLAVLNVLVAGVIIVQCGPHRGIRVLLPVLCIANAVTSLLRMRSLRRWAQKRRMGVAVLCAPS